jgi:ubiquinone/menaquinone biosynthesis C-methylase UbiE
MTVQKDPEGIEARYLHRYAGFTGTPAKRVLEVGSGDGRLTWRYAKAASQVTCIDLHADDLRIATVDRPTSLAARIHFARADALRLPFARRSFDLAIFSWSF